MVATPFSSNVIKNNSSSDFPKNPFSASLIVYPQRQFLYKPSSPAGMDIQSKEPYWLMISADVFPIKSSGLYSDEQPTSSNTNREITKAMAVLFFMCIYPSIYCGTAAATDCCRCCCSLIVLWITNQFMSIV